MKLLTSHNTHCVFYYTYHITIDRRMLQIILDTCETCRSTIRARSNKSNFRITATQFLINNVTEVINWHVACQGNNSRKCLLYMIPDSADIDNLNA